MSTPWRTTFSPWLWTYSAGNLSVTTYLSSLEYYPTRYDNRRRMGVEVLVLTMLATPTMTRWELPEKYHSDRFVIDMLVSCRHR